MIYHICGTQLTLYWNSTLKFKHLLITYMQPMFNAKLLESNDGLYAESVGNLKKNLFFTNKFCIAYNAISHLMLYLLLVIFFISNIKCVNILEIKNIFKRIYLIYCEKYDHWLISHSLIPSFHES